MWREYLGDPQDLTVLVESPQRVRTDFDGDDFGP
jgi:hypothetical protein